MIEFIMVLVWLCGGIVSLGIFSALEEKRKEWLGHEEAIYVLAAFFWPLFWPAFILFHLGRLSINIWPK